MQTANQEEKAWDLSPQTVPRNTGASIEKGRAESEGLKDYTDLPGLCHHLLLRAACPACQRACAHLAACQKCRTSGPTLGLVGHSLHFTKIPVGFISAIKMDKLCHKELSRNTVLSSDPGTATHQLCHPGSVTHSLSLGKNGVNDTTCESYHQGQRG